MISSQGMENHYQASKENYSRCSNRDCVEEAFISVGNNGQYPYMGMYNTAPHSKRKQHTPSWPPAMTLPQQSPPNHPTGRLWNAALLHNTLPTAPDLLQSHQEPDSFLQVLIQTNHKSIYPNLKQFNLIN